MKKPIRIVGIDLAKSYHSDDFYDLDLQSQLNHLSKIIRDVYRELKAAEPNCQVIIGWREYGIADKNGALKRAINHLDNKDLKKLFCDLTKVLPDLKIIAGTTTCVKELSEFKDPQKSKSKILDAYENFAFMCALESRQNINSFSTYESRALENLQFFQSKFENACRIFSAGKQEACRKKVSPSDEIPDNVIGAVYGFKDSINNFSLDGGVSANVEICLEHSVGVLKSLVEQDKLIKPNFQFVISDSANLNSEHFVGDYIIHFDSNPKNGVSFVVNCDHYNNEDVKVFAIDPYNYPGPLFRVDPSFTNRNISKPF